MEEPSLLSELSDRLMFASVPLVHLCLGILMAGYGVRELENLDWLVHHGATAEGKVIAVEMTDDGGGPYYRPTVAFTDGQGQQRETTGRYDYDVVVAGDSARVFYDPADRERIVIEADTGTARLIFCVAFGSVLALFAGALSCPILKVARTVQPSSALPCRCLDAHHELVGLSTARCPARSKK